MVAHARPGIRAVSRPVSPCQGYSRRLTTLTPGLGCASVADCPQNGEYVLGLVLFRWSRRLGEPKAQAFTQRKGNALGKRVMSRYFSVGPTGQPFAGGTCWPVGPMHLHNCAPLPRALPSLLHTRRAGRESIGAFTPLSAIPTRSNLPSTKSGRSIGAFTPLSAAGGVRPGVYAGFAIRGHPEFAVFSLSRPFTGVLPVGLAGGP